MDCLWWLSCAHYYCTVPAALIFVATALVLTVKTGWVQIRGLPRILRFFHMRSSQLLASESKKQTLSMIQALFTALSSTLGMGNIVGPLLAIAVGGPGALFWLILYTFFGAASKFVEVVFSLRTRATLGSAVVGGPMCYLGLVHPVLAWWYSFLAVVLFTAWSALQANTLACMLARDGVPHLATGIVMAFFIAFIMYKGVKRVGEMATALVPLMCLLYLVCSLSILLQDMGALWQAIKSIFVYAFTAPAAIGTLVGVTAFDIFRSGITKSIFITEAGLGTASLAHALADVKDPRDQGLLAAYSTAIDATLCLLSGLVVLVTGIWLESGFDASYMYQAFSRYAPAGGSVVFMLSVLLLVVTTLIGNTFSGRQIFAFIFKNKWLEYYTILSCVCIVLGSVVYVPLLWQVMDLLLVLVAVPNALGLVILSYRYPEWIR